MIQQAGVICISLIAFLHLYFLVLEMFFWTKPLGLKVFRQSLEKAQISKHLAANQGLYNGFIAAGLLWGLFESIPEFAKALQFFFLCCVVCAGIYGAFSVNRRIFFIQALPALVALLLISYSD